MSIEKELGMLEDLVNIIIDEVDDIPTHKEISDVIRYADKQILLLKQRVHTAQNKLAIIESIAKKLER